MNKKDVYIDSDRVVLHLDISDRHKNHLVVENVVDDSRATCRCNLKESDSLVAVEYHISNDNETDLLSYRAFTRCVYVLSLVVVVLCLFI